MPYDEAKEDGKRCEGKDAKDDDDDDFEDAIELTDIVIKPNDCAFEEPLDLEVEFDAKRPLRDATWKIGYVVDTINQTRHVVDLGTTTETDYEGKSCFFRFRVESIPVGDVEPSALANCGLLTATMFSRGREVVQLNLMCQVTLGPGDKLHRMIYSPLG
mmetsp:Transcript_2563/g.7617  ORF Transcript_2563/g.7617 Transcript_2563/m.7617 type:complete len:159 (-) Transcript_2563:64-540(-)